MNVAFAGLTVRDATALGMFIDKSLTRWSCNPVSTGMGVPLAPADLYVVDLAGWGKARWSQQAEADLLKALDGAPAVLVAPAFDQTWSALDADRMQAQSLVMLHKPYGIQEMRSALQQAAAGCLTRAASGTLSSTGLGSATTGQGHPVSRSPSRSPTTPLALATPLPVYVAAAVPVEDGEMTVSEFQTRLAALPQSARHLFLRKLAEALAQRHPFEVRVTFLNGLIFDPDEQWVASNMPMSVMASLCQSDALASVVTIRRIDDEDAMVRAQRSGMPILPLESFLWELAHQLHGKS